MRLEQGKPIDLPDERAKRLLDKAAGKVRVIAPTIPLPPLHPGWLVAYRDRRGALCGGCDDRQRGIVDACRWNGQWWTVHLTDGQQLPLSRIRSVGQTNRHGQIVAAWTVKDHGYDGEGPVSTMSPKALAE